MEEIREQILVDWIKILGTEDIDDAVNRMELLASKIEKEAEGELSERVSNFMNSLDKQFDERRSEILGEGTEEDSVKRRQALARLDQWRISQLSELLRDIVENTVIPEVEENE